MQDTPDLLAVYWRAGTPLRRWVHRPTVQDLLSPHVILVDAHWTDTDVLSLIKPGTAHSVDIMWEAGLRNQRCWYVHLQEPLRRTSIGFDTMDQVLDIVISPDRSDWYWKDEGEFNEAISCGVYTPSTAQAIRLEGESVITSLVNNVSPFCDSWDDWTPPAEWHLPVFPHGWETVPTT